MQRRMVTKRVGLKHTLGEDVTHQHRSPKGEHETGRTTGVGRRMGTPPRGPKSSSTSNPDPLANGSLKLYKDLARRSASLIRQMRTGHIGLRAFLHRIQAVDSELCPLCLTPETLQHFVLQCRRFQQQCTELRQHLDANNTRLRPEDLLNDTKNIRLLLKYVHDTNHLPKYFDDLQHVIKDQRDHQTPAGRHMSTTNPL